MSIQIGSLIEYFPGGHSPSRRAVVIGYEDDNDGCDLIYHIRDVLTDSVHRYYPAGITLVVFVDIEALVNL